MHDQAHVTLDMDQIIPDVAGWDGGRESVPPVVIPASATSLVPAVISPVIIPIPIVVTS